MFWVDSCNGKFFSMPAEGGPADLLSDSDRFRISLIPGPFIRDDAYLYWVSARTDGHYQIERIPIAGGQIELVYSGMEKIWNLAIAGGYAYWTDWIDDGATYRLLRVPLDRRSGLETVASGSEQLGGPWAAEDGVYVTAFTSLDSEVTFRRYPLTGGPPVDLWVESRMPWRVATYAGTLYWFAGVDGGNVLRALAPGAQDPVTVPIGRRALGLDADASGVLVHTGEPRGNPWQSIVPWSMGYDPFPQYIEHFSHDLSGGTVLAGWISDQPANGAVSDGSRVFWGSSLDVGATVESRRLYSASLP